MLRIVGSPTRSPLAPGREARIRSVWDRAWNQGEVGALHELYSAECRRVGAGGSGRTRTIRELAEDVLETRAAFPDLVTVIDEVIESGDRVALRWTSSGTHRGALGGMPATGQHVTVSGAVFSTFDAADRIVREFVTWDGRELFHAVGIIRIGGRS